MWGYRCKDGHVSQDDSTDAPYILCKQCGKTAYWQALTTDINPCSLKNMDEQEVHNDKQLKKIMATYFRDML